MVRRRPVCPWSADVDNIVNLKLLGHPANWGIVWVVLLFGMVGFGLSHRAVSAPAVPPAA